MMPNERAEQYIKAKPVIEAREDLRGIRVSSFPKLTKSAREKELRELNRQATVSIDDFSSDEDRVTTTQAFSQVAGALNGR
jgi:hypothetical protein